MYHNNSLHVDYRYVLHARPQLIFIAIYNLYGSFIVYFFYNRFVQHYII